MSASGHQAPAREIIALVAEAYHTFGERAARAVAIQHRVDFDDCREMIARTADGDDEEDAS